MYKKNTQTDFWANYEEINWNNNLKKGKPMNQIKDPCEFRQCIWEKAINVDRIGCFIYRTIHPFTAISPVFNRCLDLREWMKKNGWKEEPAYLMSGRTFYDINRVVHDDTPIVETTVDTENTSKLYNALEDYYYGIDKFDCISKKTGCYIYKNKYPNTAISPIFTHCHALFEWMEMNGWTIEPEIFIDEVKLLRPYRVQQTKDLGTTYHTMFGKNDFKKTQTIKLFDAEHGSEFFKQPTIKLADAPKKKKNGIDNSEWIQEVRTSLP